MFRMISLFPTRGFRLPVAGDAINPDTFEEKSLQEIGKLEIWEGNQQRELIKLFKISENETSEGSASVTIAIYGDVGKVRNIGAHMTGGEIIIEGNAGPHLGEEMSGGRITVTGDVDGWAGSMMRGGILEIHGNASDYLTAPYRGMAQGMRGGKVVVFGNVGNEAGAHMKKGVIKVHGNAGQFAGFRMRDGTIYVEGDCESRAGAGMVGGKIVVKGFLESVLPSFTIDGIRPKVRVEQGESAEGPFYVFLGDLTENGEGKLYVSKTENPQLSGYERFL